MRPPQPNYEVTYWMERAEEARTVAENLTDPVARETMLGIAAGYEGTAKLLIADDVAPKRKKAVPAASAATE
jgi:hypothetical protein